MKTELKQNAAASRFLVPVALAILVITGAYRTANAQTPTPTPTPPWVQTGTSTNINSTNAGSVGIGITTPQAKLHVKGGVIVQGATANGDMSVMTSDGATGWWDFYTSGSNGSINFFDVFSGTTPVIIEKASPTNSFFIKKTGYVGIGTSNPSTKLDVQGGPINAPGGLCLAGGVCKSDWSQVSGQWLNSPNGINYGAGNVGIGTTPTAARLVVSKGGGVGLAVLSNSNSPGQWTGLQIGRAAADGTLGVATQAGEWVANSGAGDIILRTESSANKLILNSGGGPATLTVSNGSVGIGNTNPNAAYKLDVSGAAHITGDLTVDGNLSAKYQDVAEWVPSSHKLLAGAVVVLNPNESNQVMASSTAYDTRVAGVVSERPGLTLGVAGADKSLIATTGRVKVKVDATRSPIKVGDLLVTSDEDGMAMKSIPIDLGGAFIHRPGTIIGKALEPLASGKGEILVLLSLQ